MMMKKITFLMLLFPLSMLAQDVVYDFNTKGDTEGWVKANATSLTVGDSGNANLMFSTSKNPHLKTGGGLGMSTADNGIMEIRMKTAYSTVGLTTDKGYVMNFETGNHIGSAANQTEFSIIDDGAYHIYYVSIPDNPVGTATDIDRLGLKAALASNPSSIDSLLVDYIKVRKTGTTYDGFSQNASFGDLPGSLPAWSTYTQGAAAVTTKYSADGDGTDSAIELTLDAAANHDDDKLTLWNSYVYDFTDNGLSDVSATTNINISYSVKKVGSGNVEVQPRWVLTYENDGTKTQYRSGTTAVVGNTYSTGNTYMAIGNNGRTYTSIKLGFFIRGDASDVIYIDNIKTSIDGQTLSESGDVADAQSEIAIFPNPVQNQLNIKTDKTVKEVQIINSLGKLVFITQGNSSQIGTDSLPGGIYMVTVLFEDGQTHTQRIIKQ